MLFVFVQINIVIHEKCKGGEGKNYSCFNSCKIFARLCCKSFSAIS